MLNLNISIYVPGWTKLCDLLNKEHKNTMKSLLKNKEFTIKISLAIDGWSSLNHLEFLEINCYYIDQNWKYQKKLIEFEPISEQHTGQNLAPIVENILLEYGLEKHLLAVTTDNAGNNGTMRAELHDALSQLHGVEWNHELDTISCLAHVLQLIEKQLVKGLKIDAKNETLSTSFNEDDISEVQTNEFFENTLQKISLE